MAVGNRWRHLYDLKCRVHTHKHSRGYCLRLRQCRGAAQATKRAQEVGDDATAKAKAGEVPTQSVRTAPRKDLKCRFEFYFRQCRCDPCLYARACDAHKAAMWEDAADASAYVSQAQRVVEDAASASAEDAAHEQGRVFLEAECVCESACKCRRCGYSSCAPNSSFHGAHLCVKRSSKDDPKKRFFKIQPSRNYEVFPSAAAVGD